MWKQKQHNVIGKPLNSLLFYVAIICTFFAATQAFANSVSLGTDVILFNKLKENGKCDFGENLIDKDTIRNFLIGNDKGHPRYPLYVIQNAKFESIELPYANIETPVLFVNCVFENINISYSSSKHLKFKECTVDSLDASFAKFNTDVLLHFNSFSEINLRHSKINGVLQLTDSRGSQSSKIDLSYASIANNLNANSIAVNGLLNLSGAQIGGSLFLNNANINAKDSAINGDSLRIGSTAFLHNLTTKGEVRFAGAKIDHNFECQDSNCTNYGKTSLSLNCATVNGILDFNRASFEGDLDLIGSTIKNSIQGNSSIIRNGCLLLESATTGGSIQLDSATLTHRDGYAIKGRGAHVHSTVSLSGVNAKGEIDFAGAQIEQDFNCESSNCTSSDGTSPGKTSLSLNGATIHRLLNFRKAHFNGNLDLTMATIKQNIEGNNCSFTNGGMHAEIITVGGSIQLRNAYIEHVWLNFANINSIINMAGATLASNRTSFAFENATLGSGILLTNAQIGNGIDGFSAKIFGPVHLNCKYIHSKSGNAVNLGFATLSSALNISQCDIVGRLDLTHASLTNLNCSNSTISNSSGTAIDLRFSSISSELQAVNATIDGCVDARYSNINSYLYFQDCKFTNEGNTALGLDASHLNNYAFIRHCDFKGLCSLVGTKISGSLDIQSNFLEGVQNGSIPPSLNCYGLSVDQSLRLRNFSSEGRVFLSHASIGDSIEISNATFAQALDCSYLDVKNKFDLIGIVTDGPFIFDHLEAGSNLLLQNITFRSREKDTYSILSKSMHIGNDLSFFNCNCSGHVQISNSIIGGCLSTEGLFTPKNHMLDMRNANTDAFADNKTSWASTILLDGFKYNQFSSNSTDVSIDDRLNWLERMRDFRPQPYAQLATVYTRMGNPTAATEILIEKEYREILTAEKMNSNNWLIKSLSSAKDFLYFQISRYNYKPLCAFVWLFGVFLFYSLVYSLVSNWFEYEDSKTDGTTDPKFQPFFYSLDVTLPMINLKQSNHWRLIRLMPRDRETGRKYILTGIWILWSLHPIISWTLITIGLLGVTARSIGG